MTLRLQIHTFKTESQEFYVLVITFTFGADNDFRSCWKEPVKL